MIYIHISEESLEIIQTKRSLFSREEKIISCSRKILPEKVIGAEGIINGEILLSLIKEAFKAAYPSEIKDKKISLVIPDSEVIIERFQVEKSKDISQAVIDKAKFTLPLDISAYENFYKEIPSLSEKTILYTALPLKIVNEYAQLFLSDGIQVAFLSSTAFSVYALLKSIINQKESIMYVNFGHNLKYILLDGSGPVIVSEKKSSPKTFGADLKSLLKKVHAENNLQPKSLIISGEKSLELQINDLLPDLEIPVLKIGSVLTEILAGQKITLDSGGVPVLYFDKVLGLINLSKMSDVPNFVVDIKNLSSQNLKTEIPQKTFVEETPVEIAVKQEKTTDSIPEIQISPAPLPENIIEKSTPAINSFLKNRTVLISLFVSVALILFGGFVLIGQSDNNILPFLKTETPTPTLTPAPSLTPVPTIDASLKRSDIKLSVLNGTDKSGFAKTTKDSLEELGYKNIKIGNADRDNYDKTSIKAKSAAQKYQALVINDLNKTFDTVNLESLPEEADFDIEIILGP